MAEFDTIAKELIKSYPQHFVRFLLNSVTFEIVRILTPRLTTAESREVDSLMLVKINGEECLVHIEFQTSDSTETPMPRRMAGYIGRLIEQYGLPVYAFVIYLRPNAGARDPGQYFQGPPGHRILIEYAVVRLAALEGERIISEKLWGLLPFALLMQLPENTSPEEWARECVRAVKELNLDSRDETNFLGNMSTLGGLIYDPQTLFDIISEETMYESSIARHFAERGRREGVEEGREEGRREGHREGHREGREEGRMLFVLDVISARFGSGNAEQLKPTLESIQETTLFQQILVKASQVETFEELLHEVNTLIS